MKRVGRFLGRYRMTLTILVGIPAFLGIGQELWPSLPWTRIGMTVGWFLLGWLLADRDSTRRRSPTPDAAPRASGPPPLTSDRVTDG